MYPFTKCNRFTKVKPILLVVTRRRAFVLFFLARVTTYFEVMINNPKRAPLRQLTVLHEIVETYLEYIVFI